MPAALGRLRGTGLAVAALTNSVQAVAEAQLTHAGLRDPFDAVVSADSVRRLKPAPEPYRAVAERFGADLSDVRLVAAHAWDISGALAAAGRDDQAWPSIHVVPNSSNSCARSRTARW